MIELISSTSINFIEKYSSLSNKELQKAKYGIEVFIMNIYKIVIILLLSHFIGILFHTIIFILSYSSIRASAFGVHAKTGLSCLIWTIIIFLGLAYISPYILFSKLYISLIFIYNIIIAFLYAPADTKKRPLINQIKRRRFKTRTILMLILLYIIAIFYVSPLYSTLICFASLTACTITTPLVYKFAKEPYNNYKTYQKKEA